MSNIFPYLGRLIDATKFMSYAKSLTTSDWVPRCSAVEETTTKCRPDYDDKNYTHYDINNSMYYEHKLNDDKLLTTGFFDIINAKKDGHVAKIIWSDPGNTEPPHIDYFPSFLGDTKSDGNLWSTEDLALNSKKIVRVWIPLTDSKVGHILFGNGYALTSWSAGDVFHIVSGNIHGFTNAGRERRYALVVTSWIK